MFPRFLKWDLKGWPNDFKTKHIRCLHSDQVIDCNLIMTEKERAAIDRQLLDLESESEDDSTSISSESNEVPSASSNSSSSNQNVNSQPTEGSISANTKLNEALLTIDRLEKERDEAKQESQKLKHDNVEHEKQIAQMHGELEELRKSLLREKELKNMLNSEINFAIDSDNQSYEKNAAGVGEKEDVIKVAENDYSKALVIRGDVSPTSMVKAIKGKDRVQIEESDFEYVYYDRRDRTKKAKKGDELKVPVVCNVEDYKASKDVSKPKRLQKNTRTYRFIDPEDKKKLREIEDIGKDSTMVWSGSNFILWREMVNLVNNGMVSNNLIDAYSEYMMRTHKTDEGMDGKAFVVTSSCMTFLGNNREDLIQKHMSDKILKYAPDCRFIIFPLHSAGHHNAANHWTTLVCDKEEGWLHFNSILPRNKNTEDPYLKDATRLKNYYNTLFGIPSQIEGDDVRTMWDAPQQAADSLWHHLYVHY
ncbi:uncharacterized protein LOC119982759 isoform X2 [Tripterygium wilfordii]|uniref:uncharacterized protein LOC119982759 isoform X2 n=1 Tax=Tripterygium wilfordii TaxID=458696 RepID=UPI0018F854AC|nr:uncharacterized protein LOC119982759 isoform X2 [Tripterygium wilfordii]